MHHGQERLNNPNLLTLHVHKDYTDKLDLMAVTNEFVSHSEHRLSTFEKYNQSVYLTDHLFILS